VFAWDVEIPWIPDFYAIQLGLEGLGSITSPPGLEPA
jgi:hypothetical protein